MVNTHSLVLLRNYIVQYSFIGYESIEVPVTIKSGITITLSKALGASSYKLDVVITTTANKQKKPPC
jgi:hypothetical protein